MAVRRFLTLGLMLAALVARSEQLMPTPDDAVPRDPTVAVNAQDVAPAPITIPEPDRDEYSPASPSSDD